MKKYAIYLRKSREDAEKEKLGAGETLTRHKKILTEHAARHGLYVGKIYQEIVSGETIKDRPEIQKLINDCYAGMWAGIIIVEVTRLSRGNQGDAQIILDCLKYSNSNNGVLVITPTKVYDVAHSSDDEEYMEFELFMSRREYKMIQKRMDRGRKQAVVEGNFMGSYRPYGWNIVKTKTERTLEPHPTEFEIGKLMYEWAYKENLTPGRIAARLTTMGVPTYYGEKEWNKESVKDFLKNPVNMGKVRWNDRMQVKTMVNGELVTSRPRSNHTDHYMLYDGKQPKMVSEEVFNAVNSRFKSDRTKRNLKLINPLAGILVCQKCGKAMVYQPYNTKPTVQPRYLHKDGTICKVRSVIAADVMNAVVHSLKLYMEDYELKVDNLPEVNENLITTQIEALQKELVKVKKKLSKVFDDYEDEVYTANEFVERKAKHNARIEEIEKQMAALENSIPEKEEYEEKVRMLSDALNALLDKELDADIKNEFLKRIIDRIEFSREQNDEFILDVFLKP